MLKTRGGLSGGLMFSASEQLHKQIGSYALSILPKHAVSKGGGYIKGKSAIHLARVYGERKRNFVGRHCWARGYFVSMVGRDEAVIRAYIRNQEQEDRRLDHMEMWR